MGDIYQRNSRERSPNISAYFLIITVIEHEGVHTRILLDGMYIDHFISFDSLNLRYDKV